MKPGRKSEGALAKILAPSGNFADSCRDCQVSKDFGTLICACDDVSTGVTRVSQFDMSKPSPPPLFPFYNPRVMSKRGKPHAQPGELG